MTMQAWTAATALGVGNWPARVMAVVLAVLLGCGGGYEGTWMAEDRFQPLSSEETEALERMRGHIAGAIRLVDSGQLSAEEHARLTTAVWEARHALNRYIALREQGTRRRETLGTIQAASVFIVADNATLIGTGDDVLLAVGAFIAVGTTILTSAPASRDALAEGWRNVGQTIDILGKELAATQVAQAARAAQAAGARAAGNAVPQPSPMPLPLPPADDFPANGNEPVRPPANQNRPGPKATTDVTPVPVPQPRPDDDDEGSRCKPRPRCPHLGGDAIHDMCADTVLNNVFSGCDVEVNGKRFDALDPRGVLWEVKTDDWVNYSDFLKERSFRGHFEEIEEERDIAAACGIPFRVAIADRKLYDRLADVFGKNIVKHKPECRRQVKK